jgi:hypothetical protein
MEKINVMRTLNEVLDKLKSRGEDNEFVVLPEGDQFEDSKTHQQYATSDLKIVKTYRFEGDSDPGDMTVIFLVEASDGTRGYIMDAYGTYSAENPRFGELLKEIPIERPAEEDERGE